ncbi:hypothetical protein ACFHWS_23610 [Micromonospora sp. LOL_013]
MMPGAPGAPGAGAGGGSGVPDRPDSAGLVDGDLQDWQPPTGTVDVPDAPAGASAGGAGLGDEGTPANSTGFSTPPPIATPSQSSRQPDAGFAPGAHSGPVGGVPPMPGAPGSPGAQSGGNGQPDRPDATGLVEGDIDDWAAVGPDLPAGPQAPGGATAGGAGLGTVPVEPPRDESSGPIDPAGSAGTSVSDVPGPVAGQRPAAVPARQTGADRPAAPVAFGVPPVVNTAEEREPVDRPDAADLLREDEVVWARADLDQRKRTDDRVPVVRPAEDAADPSHWADPDGIWWLRGPEPEREMEARDA